MIKATRDYHKDLIRDLKDPEEAAAYLNAALEAGDKQAFLLALRNVAEAFGGMTRLARQTRIHRISLYKMTSKRGNPSVNSIMNLLEALGLKLSISRKSSRLKHAA
jgi:probable addiction module antidote protein